MQTILAQSVTNLPKSDPKCDKFKLLVNFQCDFTLEEITNAQGYVVSQFEFSTKSIRTPQNYGAIWRGIIVEYSSNTGDVCVIQVRETGQTFFVGGITSGIGSWQLINFQYPLLVPSDFTLIVTNYRFEVGSTDADSANIYLTNQYIDPFSATNISAAKPF